MSPLIPQLALAWLRARGRPPGVLQSAATGGARHIGVLSTLVVGGPNTVSGLAERVGISMPHASLVIGELAKAGLVDREPDPSDRRRVVVSLSANAQPAVEEMRRRHVQPLERFLAELDGDEASTFLGHLARLVALMTGDA